MQTAVQTLKIEMAKLMVALNECITEEGFVKSECRYRYQMLVSQIKDLKSSIDWFKSIGYVIVFLLVGCNHAWATIPDDVAIHCILGEARGEGYESLVAHGEALRNRGTTNGVYGCKANFNEPKWVWDMGRKAWNESAASNKVSGASYWGSTILDKKWINKMKRSGYKHIVTIKNTEFYKN